eukprot:Hpha_TRINITY_DN30748_c0_g1::TRINITY_DN30748_c0_g1_i1::g.28440::m.28440
MSGVRVRPFIESDADCVRQVFDEGMMTIPPEASRALWVKVRSKLYGAAVLVAGLFRYKGSSWVKAFSVPAAGVLALYLVVRLMARREIRMYIEAAKQADLRDIKSYYMSHPKTHFWVAECERTGEVLGCVGLDKAAREAIFSAEEEMKKGAPRYGHDWVELRRMSVTRKARGRGVAKALQNVLVEHAKGQGLTGITLSTSSAQIAAIGLYRKLGYKEVYSVGVPMPMLGNCLTVHYYEWRIE